ncbi:hypothetical protein [Flavobacterium sp. GSB-24]|uniref:hypothetical protein n=1 Tax=Flavobacterium sp. GSB-24 TaxID=2994319 RepID=UPI00248FFCB0|nr:hypothetical protein [Flavobacterium sp. GSB-24]
MSKILQIGMYLCEISIKEYLLIIIACCFDSLNFMKNLKAPFLAVALILLNVSFMLAGPTPPSPTAKTAGTMSLEDDDGPGGPGSGGPDFPIDQNTVFLLVSGLALGATIIYKNQIKKASI